jgi:hypothetical protein
VGSTFVYLRVYVYELVYCRCPVCRAHNNSQDVRRAFLDTEDGAVELKNENMALRQELEDVKAKLLQKEAELERSRAGLHGSRIHRNRRFDDSTCFNCESVSHETSKCPLSCFIRQLDYNYLLCHANYNLACRFLIDFDSILETLTRQEMRSLSLSRLFPSNANYQGGLLAR